MQKLVISILFIFFQTNIFCQPENAKLKITPLTGDFYIYTTYSIYEGSPVPANGMYLVTNDGVVIFDTP